MPYTARVDVQNCISSSSVGVVVLRVILIPIYSNCDVLVALDANVATHFASSWQYIVLAIAVGALMEAFTGHIDNLVLPPFLSTLLLLT